MVKNKTASEYNECLFIDDAEENIHSAKELGMSTIHFTNHKQFIIEIKQLLT